jgi:hypothetical protein
VKQLLFILIFVVAQQLGAQENPNLNPPQSQTQLRVNELVDKKAEYHRLTGGVQIHLGIDREEAETVRAKFSTQFTDYDTYKEYQLPNFVVLVGDFKTKLEAFESWKKIQVEYPNAFIVKGKIKVL